MVSFFRINDPVRIFGVLLLMIAFWIPVHVFAPESLLIEQEWMLLGEKMAGGDVLYMDIQTNMPPLSASVYWLLYNLFGKSSLVYQILALILVFTQAMVFNFMMDRTDVLKERSYIPSLLYITFSFIYTDMLTLSPLLLSMTFVLIALRELLYLLKHGNNDQGVFRVGFYVGIATLFYFPSGLFLIMVVFSYLFYTNTVLRRYVILLFSFSFPILMVGMHYFIKGGMSNYFEYFWWKSIYITKIYTTHWIDFLILLAVPAIFLAYSMFAVFSSRGYIIYQSKIQRVMALWVFCSVGIYFLADEKGSFLFVLLIPAISYFGTAMFFVVRRSLFRELSYVAILVLILFVHLGSLKGLGDDILNPDRLAVGRTELQQHIKDQKILVLDKNFSGYAGNRVATRFFDWRLSIRSFENLDYMKNPVMILEAFREDPPEVIVDRLGIAEKLFLRIKPLDDLYQPHETLQGVYVKKRGQTL